MFSLRKMSLILVLMCVVTWTGSAEDENPPMGLREFVKQAASAAPGQVTADALAGDGRVFSAAAGHAQTGCSVSPVLLDFGSVAVGSSSDLDFTIHNNESTSVSGTVSETCGCFLIVSGGGEYSLAPGESLVVTVQFEPATSGMYDCPIHTGCGWVQCQGDTGYRKNAFGKWALHYVGPHDSKANTCDFQLTDCEDADVDAPSGPGRYDVYLIAVDVDGIAGHRFGLSCDGPPPLIYGWTNCLDFEIPTAGWPGCGEGNAATVSWEQPGPYVTLGILDVYIYGTSSLSTSPDPRVGFAEWCDGSSPNPVCNKTQELEAFSTVGFGLPGGIDCGPDTCLAPVLMSPADGLDCAATDVNLDWGPVYGAAGYEVQIGTSCGAGAVYGTTSSEYSPPSLSPYTEYSWRARAECSAGWGPWSECRSFTTSITIPDAPVHNLPLNGATCESTVVTLDWGDVLGAVGYEVQVGTSCGAGATYATVGSNKTVAGLASGTTYYWRLRTEDGCGALSVWSDCWSFRTSKETLGVATLSLPGDGAACQSAALVLDWEDVPGAVGYEVRVGTSCGAGTVYATVGSDTTMTGLAPGATYYWNVRATADCDVRGDWSGCWSFTMSSLPPGIPALNLPADGAECLYVNVPLDWGDVPGAVGYEVQIGTSCGAGTIYATTGSDTTVIGLASGMTYYWRARAGDTCGGMGGWSECWSLTTSSTPPGAPVHVAPLNDATCESTVVTFDWEDVSGAVTYQLQVGLYCGGGTAYKITGSDTTLTGLMPTRTHYWRVRALDACGAWSDWSDCWHFKTFPDSPGVVSLTSPANGANCVPLDAYLDWAGVGEVDYELQLGTSCGAGTTYARGSSYAAVTGLAAYTTYHWRVRVNAGCDIWGDWSDCWSFTTGPPAPGAPILSAPPNGATDMPTSVQLIWDCLPEAVSYELQVGTSCGTGNVYSTSSCKRWVGLSYETEYCWRVRAKVACGIWGDWSGCWCFQTREAPPPSANPNGGWALHFAGQHNSKLNTCDFQIYSCNNVVDSAPYTSGRFDVYVLAVDVDAIAGTRYGISCDDPSFFFYGWTKCSDFEIPSAGWPDCGEGNAQTWTAEQPGPHVTVGILDVYVYGGSMLSVDVDPRVGFAEWCDGSAPEPICDQVTDPADFGSVGFGMSGYTPCNHLIPVELEGFRTTATDEGILLEWTAPDITSTEDFYVHRSAIIPEGDYLKLHEIAVECGGAIGGACSYLDTDVTPGTLYYYKLEAIEPGGRSVFFGPYPAMATERQSHYRLSQNVPNPFRRGSTTTIHYSAAEAANVKVIILDAAGRLVRTIVDRAERGDNWLTWDGADRNGRLVAAGIYFYEIQAGGFSDERKMLVVD